MSRGSMGERTMSNSETTDVVRGEAQWLKLEFGFIKVNTDATWFKNTRRMGPGWVCCDFVGLLQAAGGSGTDLYHSAAVGEAFAIRDAILACSNYGFEKVIIESMPR